MRSPAIIFLSCALAVAALGQQATPPLPKRNPPVMPTSRLAVATTAFVKDAGGNPIPYNVISMSMDGWGRFAMVDNPEKADIILEVSSPAGGSGVSVSSKTETSPRSGVPESSTSTTRELGTGPIRLTVIDGKSKSVLWSGSEQPKSALRKKSQEDNLVDAAEKLFTKFHDRVEPISPK